MKNVNSRQLFGVAFGTFALGPGQIGSLWIYLLAPTIGAWLGVWACRAIREPGCCGGQCAK